MLKLERIKDFLLMEEEFIQNQERLKPQEEKNLVRNLVNKNMWISRSLPLCLNIMFISLWALALSLNHLYY